MIKRLKPKRHTNTAHERINVDTQNDIPDFVTQNNILDRTLWCSLAMRNFVFEPQNRFTQNDHNTDLTTVSFCFSMIEILVIQCETIVVVVFTQNNNVQNI